YTKLSNAALSWSDESRKAFPQITYALLKVKDYIAGDENDLAMVRKLLLKWASHPDFKAGSPLEITYEKLKAALPQLQHSKNVGRATEVMKILQELKPSTNPAPVVTPPAPKTESPKAPSAPVKDPPKVAPAPVKPPKEEAKPTPPAAPPAVVAPPPVAPAPVVAPPKTDSKVLGTYSFSFSSHPTNLERNDGPKNAKEAISRSQGISKGVYQRYLKTDDGLTLKAKTLIETDPKTGFVTKVTFTDISYTGGMTGDKAETILKAFANGLHSRTRWIENDGVTDYNVKVNWSPG
ncbi:MAG: hypothetical protein JNK65_07835, partial [Deltaproteobacteria bacterium]|nr:hypothetical protein [Deltaproteobacteria bacterium]